MKLYIIKRATNNLLYLFIKVHCLTLTLIVLNLRSLKTNGKRDRNFKNQPEQLWPFPMYPGLQLQLKDPSVLVQVAFSLQL